EGLLAFGASAACGGGTALSQPELPPLIPTEERELPGPPVHRQNLEQIRAAELPERSFDLLGPAPQILSGIAAPEHVLDAAEDLVDVERLPQPTLAEPTQCIGVDAARGEHHRDVLGPGIGPEDLHEGPRFDQAAVLVEQDESRMAQQRDLDLATPVTCVAHR